MSARGTKASLPSRVHKIAICLSQVPISSKEGALGLANHRGPSLPFFFFFAAPCLFFCFEILISVSRPYLFRRPPAIIDRSEAGSKLRTVLGNTEYESIHSPRTHIPQIPLRPPEPKPSAALETAIEARRPAASSLTLPSVPLVMVAPRVPVAKHTETGEDGGRVLTGKQEHCETLPSALSHLSSLCAGANRCCRAAPSVLTSLIP